MGLKTMESYGIRFELHASEDHSEADEAKVAFFAFAALCWMYGVADLVLSVYWDSKDGNHVITAQPGIEHSEQEGFIALAADHTLPAFQLFDVQGYKGFLEDESGFGRFDA